MTDPTQQPPTEGQPTEGQPPAGDQPAAPPPAEPAQPPAADAPDDQQSSSDAQAEIAQLRADLERAEADKQHAVADALAQQSGQAPSRSGPTVDLSGLSQHDRRERFASWPELGGGDLPQPWDMRALGLQNALRDFMDDTKPGTRNTVSPIVIHHGKPILTYGSSDPSVQELGRILGDLGFDNSVSDGQNPFGSVDNTVMAAVYAFRDAYGVQEDPSGFGGNTPDGRSQAAAHIGPWTWEAILRAGAHYDAEQDAA